MAEHVVAQFATCRGRVRSHRLVLARTAVLPDVCREILVESRNLISVSQMRPHGIATRRQISSLILEIERANPERALNTIIFIADAFQSVAERQSVIAAHRQPQALNHLIVNPCRHGIFVRNLKLVRTSSAVSHKTVGAKPLGVEPRQQLRLVAPAAQSAPHANARLVPRARQNLTLALGPVNREKLDRQMVLIHSAYRHHHFARAHIQPAPETLLQPELFKRNLAAALNFGLVLARLVGVNLNRRLGSAVLKLNFGAHCPAAPEVVANIQHHVRQVHLSVAFVVLVLLGKPIAIEMVAVEIARHNGLAVPANRQARRSFR